MHPLKLYRSWCKRLEVPSGGRARLPIEQQPNESEESWIQRFNEHIRQCPYCQEVAKEQYPERYIEAMKIRVPLQETRGGKGTYSWEAFKEWWVTNAN